MNEFFKISSAWKHMCTWKKKGVTKNREYFTAGLFHLLLLSVLYPHSCNHHRTSRCFLVCQLLGSWRDLGILGDIKKSQKPCYSFTRNIEIKKNKIYSLPPHWNLEGSLIFFLNYMLRALPRHDHIVDEVGLVILSSPNSHLGSPHCLYCRAPCSLELLCQVKTLPFLCLPPPKLTCSWPHFFGPCKNHCMKLIDTDQLSYW